MIEMRKVVILLKTKSDHAWDVHGLGDEVSRSKSCLQCLAVQVPIQAFLVK